MPSSGAIQPINFANVAGIGCVVMLIVPVDEFDKSLTWFPDVVYRFPRAKIADLEQGIVLFQFVPLTQSLLPIRCTLRKQRSLRRERYRFSDASERDYNSPRP